MRSDVDRYSRGEPEEERRRREARAREEADREPPVQMGEDPGNLAADGADGADAGRS